MGGDGTVLRFSSADLSGLRSAETNDGFIRAARDLAGQHDGIADPGTPFEAEIEALRQANREIEVANAALAALGATGAADPQAPPATEPEPPREFDAVFFQTWGTRIGVVVLLMFLVAIFSTLYRYSLRMAAFYDSRADALTLTALEETDLGFDELARILGPDTIDFARARSPSDHAFGLASRAVDALGKRGGSSS